MTLLPSNSREKFSKAVNHFKMELNQLRTGRASPSLVEYLPIDAYGIKTPLIELASINTPEIRQILIQPWDPNIIKDIEKAIKASSLGLTPTVDGQFIRLNLPALTEERRKEIIKIMTGMLEVAKVQIRSIREDINKSLKTQERAGDISEDEMFAAQKELQKIVEGFNEQVKLLSESKEKEIMTI
ncbi:MAG: ribosome recycling factor [Patescibacteria group bacterium]